MRKTAKRFFAILLAVTMLVGLLPTLTLAGSAFDGEGKASESVYVYTDEDYAAVQNDVFAKIETVKADAAAQLGGIGRMTEQNYVDLVPQVISAVESSETYVPGTLQQNGNFLVWMTSTGLPCCYSPRMEAQLHNTEDDPTPADIAKAEERAAAILEAASTRGIGPTSMDIGLIQPFWESTSNYADSSFNNYSPSYKAMWQSLAEATGGNTIRYSMSNATIDNIASTMSQCGVVIFDSHGDTDYSGSNQDYTSRANTSYLCLTATSGFTSVDTAAQTGEFGTYYNAMVSNGYGFVNGTAIANHMAGNAPNSLLYMGICLGMATDGMHKGLRQKGVEVVHGYSQSVTFVGEEIYMNSILGYVKDGMTYSEAITTTKNETCWWDPHPSYTGYTEAQAAADDIAFPIVVSSEDVYPGHGNVDAIQNVYSTWSLFGDAFEVTAVSNNTGWGTVAVSGYTITASPAEGYFAQGYTVLNGTATVTQDGNVFRVRPETDCTVQINFAAKTPAVVTYVSSGTTVGTVNTFIGDDVILPADVTEIPGWTFLGWMTDHISMTTEKPAYMKPGTSYTVNAANVTIFAVYKHVEGSGGLCYQLVTETPRGAFDGRYVISSAKDSSMNVMTGVSGNVNVESGSAGFTAFGSTGIELEDNALRNVDDAYIFEVEEQGSSAYSFQNVDAGSYLAVYDSYFWVRENYESAYCNWTITPSADGAVLRCGASTSYPYLSWSGSRWMASSGSSYVQLWKEYDDGTTYYWTDPVVEAHDHVMTAYPAVAPTCGANGHTAYWQCSVCYKYFSDAAGENEITLSSTVIPATGNHSYGAWISNDNGTHDHVCTVCGAAETESCVYESVVTAPTPTEGGYTTYTCTVCGYTYVGNNTSPTGYDFTIVFSVPLECEQPYDMICNNLTGVTLPVLEAPEGYTFLGWVEQPYDNVDARPAEIYSGHYTTNADVTLYALFKYVEADGSGEFAYELVTAQPADWTGNYVITYNNTTALYAMKGMDADVSYEDTGNGSAVAYASTGMTLTEDVLTDVADAFVFHVAQESSGKYSIQSIDFDTYVGITDGTLTAIGDYESSTCDYTLTLESAGNVSAYMSTAGTWPYIAFTTNSNEFWCFRSTSGIYFWKEVNAGTPYWTTVIGGNDDTEEDLVDVYFVDQDDNANAYVYAFGPGAENAAFPGEQLTPMGVDESGDNWYKITLDRNVYTNVIFSGGDNSTQTADLWVGEDDAIVYYINGHTGYVGIDLWPAPPEVIPATCTAAALENYTGLLTGEVHVHEVGLPLGHDWGEWEVTTAPGCVDGGVQTRTCARCGEIETEQLEPLGHLPSEPVQENYVEPTATEDGGYDTVTYCQRCGAELSRDHTVLPATGPVEPIETTNLRIFNSISVKTDMIVTWTVRKTDVQNYEKFWIEVVKHSPEGDETFLYGDGYAEPIDSNTSAWLCRFNHIFAKEMGVEVEARVYAQDAAGQVYMSPATSTNIRDYLGGRLTATNNKVEQRVLAADMLNYGTAAQLFIGFMTDHLVNEELTAEQLAKLEEYETKELPLAEKTNSNVCPEGETNILFNSVTLGNEVQLKLSIRLDADAGTVQVQVKDHNTGDVVEILDAESAGTYWSAKWSGIGAKQMRTEFEFVTLVNGVETGNIRTWSVEAYVGEIRAGTNELKTNMANALLTYGDSVAAYVAAQ